MVKQTSKKAFYKLEHIFLTLLHETGKEKNLEHKDFFKDVGLEFIQKKDINDFILERGAWAVVKPKDIYKKWNGGREKLRETEKKFIENTIYEYMGLRFVWRLTVKDTSGENHIVQYTYPRVHVVILCVRKRKYSDSVRLIDEPSARIQLIFHPEFLRTSSFLYPPEF